MNRSFCYLFYYFQYLNFSISLYLSLYLFSISILPLQSTLCDFLYSHDSIKKWHGQNENSNQKWFQRHKSVFKGKRLHSIQTTVVVCCNVNTLWNDQIKLKIEFYPIHFSFFFFFLTQSDEKNAQSFIIFVCIEFEIFDYFISAFCACHWSWNLPKTNKISWCDTNQSTIEHLKCFRLIIYGIGFNKSAICGNKKRVNFFLIDRCLFDL